jgi:Spy/CpxP family protein refolding chaperone
MTSAHSPGWQNPRILLTLTVVFLCGVTAGMVAMSLIRHNTPQPTFKGTEKEVSLQRFKTELNLTPAQTEQLETVLDDFFTYYHTLQAQLDDVRASGKQRILRILNEEQKKKFQKIMLEMQDKRLH